MPFEPKVNGQIVVEGVVYRIAEHPQAPGMPYAMEGRQSVVYQLLTGQQKQRFALKVFHPQHRALSLVSQASQLSSFADLPGLQVCKRTVLAPQRHPMLLRQHPELSYAVLMPWIEGPTWQRVMLDHQELTPGESLRVARGLATVLEGLEQRGAAHCELSSDNLLLPTISSASGLTSQAPGSIASPNTDTETVNPITTAVELVDVEQMFGLMLSRPKSLPSSSEGYTHKMGSASWGQEADRFAGAVLLAEILGWCDERVRDKAWGASYFEPGEMQKDSARYTLLLDVLRDQWGDELAFMFEQAWKSESLPGCPGFIEWGAILATLTIKVPTSKVSTSLPAVASSSLQPQLPPPPVTIAHAKITGAPTSTANKPHVIAPVPTVRSSPTVRSTQMQVSVVAPHTGQTARTSQPMRRIPATVLIPGVIFVAFVAIWLSGYLPFGRLPEIVATVTPTSTATQQVATATAIIVATQQASPTSVSVTETVVPDDTPTPPSKPTSIPPTATATATATYTFQPPTSTPSVTPVPPASHTDRIAFVSNRAGDEEIYVMDANGNSQARITFSPGGDQLPAWSPDGQQIAFTSHRDGNWNIYTMNANGTNVMRLTDDLADDRHPTWSPDGGQIAFTSDRDGNFDLFVMNADGSEQVPLTRNTNADSGPDWSPDGRYLAFNSNREGNYEIYKLDVFTKVLTRLTNNSTADDAPAWSRGGSRIAFNSIRTGNYEVFVMDADGSNQIQLTYSDKSDDGPSWSPDGRHIVFNAKQDNDFEIYVMDADGNARVALTSNDKDDQQPAWSP